MDIVFHPAREADFERLLALRLDVMRESLERLGRFDAARARARFRGEFAPEHMRLIHADGRFAGCVSAKPATDGALWIEHFYLAAEQQGAGLGAAVMRRLLAEADAAGRDIRLGVLVESDANRFYKRFGFVETHREAFDIYYLRRARPGGEPRRAPPVPRS